MNLSQKLFEKIQRKNTIIYEFRKWKLLTVDFFLSINKKVC